MRQDHFLLRFVELLERQQGCLKELAAELHKPFHLSLMKQVVLCTGIQFRTFFCLVAIAFKETCREQGVLLQDGHNVRAVV